MTPMLAKSTLRFWTIVMIVLSLLCAPALAEIHSDTGEAICEHTELQQNSDTTDIDTDHHVHSCGSCHAHVFMRDTSMPPLTTATRETVPPESLKSPIEKRVFDLLRPPRV